jgi:hypothetical protein
VLDLIWEHSDGTEQGCHEGYPERNYADEVPRLPRRFTDEGQS